MIKKTFLIICILCLLIGCDNKHSTNNDNLDIDENNSVIDDNSNIDKYIDDNPIKVSLYDGNKKITSYNTTLANFKDIAVFDIIYTDKDILDSSNTKNNYLKYYNEYEDIDDYKTGFFIFFEADGKLVEELVLDPSSQHNMTPYLYIYLYDDVNQAPNTYYSHLEMKDFNDSTIISSIKLFLAQEGIKITSPITMTVFTYNGDEDFDENNRYRGNSSYTIIIDIK